ncbi:MAG: mannosyltransferase 3 [Acidobacteriota bacterium]|nr:mannosyltransferase 3 [Acidobacteriota bacterium]
MPANSTKTLLASLLGAATLVRLSLGYIFFGFHTGDDVEILQEGFLRALGWPYRPWEIRNLLVPDALVAPAVWLASALGVTSTRTLVWLASLPFVLLASVNVLLVFLLARRWLEREGPALLAAALYACHWIPLGYGSTVYPRTVSTTCILLAALLLGERDGGRWREALAGGVLAVAFAVRYSEGIFLLPAFVALWLRGGSVPRRIGRCAVLLGGFLAFALLTVGLVDGLTWGHPFSSLAAFTRYTLVDRRSSSLVVSQPWYWFFWRLPKWLPITLLPFLWRARRVPGAARAALFLVLPLLALSGIHHKELRYLQGILPFVALLAAAGAWSWWESGRKRLTVAFCALSLLLGLKGIGFLRDKSMAAVQASQALAKVAQHQSVALSQAWAYGGNLYLRPAVSVFDLPVTEKDLRSVLGKVQWVALYEKDLRSSPELGALLKQRGFVAGGEHRWGRSRPVILFAAPQSGVISTRTTPGLTMPRARAAP